MGENGAEEFASGEEQVQRSVSEEEISNNPPTGKEDEGSTSKGTGAAKKNKFSKKFNSKDEKKILKALLKHDCKIGSRDFHRKANLKLSVNADEFQVYEKVRGLKAAYFKRRKEDPNKLEGVTRRIQQLSHKIWADEPEPPQRKRKRKRQVSDEEEDEVTNSSNNKEIGVKEFKERFERFLKLVSMYNKEDEVEDEVMARCPVSEALEMAPFALSDKVRVVKEWNELQLQQSKLRQRKRDFVSKIIQVVESSPFFIMCRAMK